LILTSGSSSGHKEQLKALMGNVYTDQKSHLLPRIAERLACRSAPIEGVRLQCKCLTAAGSLESRQNAPIDPEAGTPK